MGTNLRTLIAKLNTTSRKALEAADGLCLSRTHYNIEIEYVLLKLLDVPGSDFAGIERHFEVNNSRLAQELGRSLDKLKSGNGRKPAMSPAVLDMLREAWIYASLEWNAETIRTGHLILALAGTEDLL